MKRVHVAAAVIRGVDGRILIARRADDKHQGGLWEFPGGKVEDGEAVRVALDRELQEELGIRPQAARPLIQIRHDYPDKQVLLDVWEVSAFSGEPHGAEGQPLAWVSERQLLEYEFPAANKPIVAAARLPERYLITPDGLEPSELLAGIRSALAQGVRLDSAARAEHVRPAIPRPGCRRAGPVCRQGATDAQGTAGVAGDFPAAGWHLTAEQLRKYAASGRPFPDDRWLAASCHNADELALAAQMGVDFVTLSPVQATATHPEALPLGWEAASEMLTHFNLPAYLLGGVGPADIERAWQVGAQGVAGIRAFWPASTL